VQYWQITEHDGVVTAAFDNPPMNYFCYPAVSELTQLTQSWRDDRVRAIILTGAHPGRFITHYSVEELLALAKDHELLRTQAPAVLETYHAMVTGLRDLPKPVIAALSGDTMGGGLEIALCCDLRIAASGDFRFGLPEIRLGITPGGTGTQILTRLIGAAKAKELILRGRVVSPQQALDIGIVHEVATDALQRAREIASDLARQSGPAMAAVKHAIHSGSDLDLPHALALDRKLFLDTMLGQDSIRLMSEYVAVAFRDRRQWIDKAP
jgi:enoyl-CoA hydratase/carnithine racemase